MLDENLGNSLAKKIFSLDIYSFITMSGVAWKFVDKL